MKKGALSSLLIFATILSFAQGIQFENGNWNEIIAKAKKENKLIYLDAYTTWCGPCKMMAKKYFPDEEIGNVYNKNFINVSMDAEKGEGIEIANKFHVIGYPTNLFINPENLDVVYKSMGAPEDKKGFIKNGQIAIAERNDKMKVEEYTSIFNSNQYDETFLKKCINKYEYKDLNNDKLLDAYIDRYSMKHPVDTNIEFLESRLSSLNSKAFDYVYEHMKAPKEGYTKMDFVESILYKTIEYAGTKKDNVYFEEGMQKFKSLFPSELEKSLYYTKYFYVKYNNSNRIWDVYNNYANFLVAKSSASYEADNLKLQEKVKNQIRLQLQDKNLSKEKEEETIEKSIKANPALLHQASVQASTELNAMAWDVFEKNRKDSSLISKAILWAQKAVELVKTESIIDQLALKDTYACLLYASGKKVEAISLESEIIELAKKEKMEDISGYEETLNKMKEGSL